jgi:hypothetical protein
MNPIGEYFSLSGNAFPAFSFVVDPARQLRDAWAGIEAETRAFAFSLSM